VNPEHSDVSASRKPGASGKLDLQASPDPEAFWADVLSTDPDRIREALRGLTPDERRQVLDHLRRMEGDEGWQADQRRRARAALAAVDGSPPTW